MQEAFKIEKPRIFNPSAETLFTGNFPMGRRPYAKVTFNPTASDAKNFGYLPRLTLQKMPIKGKWTIFLDIEFSAPKVLFSNNFQEIIDSNFNDLIKALQYKLNDLGVITSDLALRKALVQKVHYAKNIVFEDGTIVPMVLKELSKADLSLRLDKNDKEYRNDGYSVKWHSNSIEFIAYDKKADLGKSKLSEKRAIEKDNQIQMGLFDVIQQIKPYEVLRFEIRLNDDKAIKRTFESMSIGNKELTFESLFSVSISQWILLKYWQELKKTYNLFNFGSDDFATFLAEIKFNNKNIKLQKAVMLFSLRNLIRTIGTREFRNTLSKYFDVRSWYALKKSLNDLELKTRLPNSLEHIDKVMDEFQPLQSPNTILFERRKEVRRKSMNIEEYMQ